MQIVNLAKRLEAVGLSDKQARVYVAALFLGPSAVQRIAEQADVNRATTYVILAELAEMGLVSESIEGKKTVYVAEPPEAIERYLTSMEKVIGERKEGLKSAMSELKTVSRVEVSDAPVVRFFKGPEAAKSVKAYLNRKAGKNEVVYSISDVNEVLKIFPNVLEESPRERLKKNIASRLFYSGDIPLKDDPTSARKVKKMDVKAKADLNIYSDRLTILSYKASESTGVIIESKEIVAVIRQLFELAWKNQSKK